jgi:hypothetical protein
MTDDVGTMMGLGLFGSLLHRFLWKVVQLNS